MACRAEERTPFTTVVFQECERMNALMAEIKTSLVKLNLGLKVRGNFTQQETGVIFSSKKRVHFLFSG